MVQVAPLYLSRSSNSDNAPLQVWPQLVLDLAVVNFQQFANAWFSCCDGMFTGRCVKFSVDLWKRRLL